MNKHFLPLIIILLIVVGCGKEQDSFLISTKSIGLLNDSTQVKDLKMIFPNDSIANLSKSEAFSQSNYDIEVFDKDGSLLLVLSPDKMVDSTSTIKTIKVLDPRYKTVNGLNAMSTFGDIKNNYKISSIQNTLKNVVVFINEIDAFITIDKKELPSELQFNMSAKIESVQIPDTAKIKYFMIGW